jgi:6-phosphogluconolactonase
MKIKKILTVALISVAMLTVSFAYIRKEKPENARSNWVYVGSYTQKEPHVQGKAKGIYIYEMNTATGALAHVATSPETVNPSYVAIHPDGKWLYAVNETGDGKISAFKIDRDNKKMEFLNAVSSNGNSPCYISIDNSGKFVMTANYGSGTVALYPLNDDGTLKEATSVIKHTGKGPDPRQSSPHAHMIRPGNNPELIYAVDLGADRVFTYQLDKQKASLQKINEYAAVPGAGPRHIDFHPGKKWAYVVNELNGTVEACTVDPTTGALKRFQEITTLPQGETRKAGCADIHVSKDGKFLYASNRGEINNIAIYAIDAATGNLSPVGHQSVKGKGPRSFVIDPSGTFLLVANQDSNNIVTFRIDRASGKLTDTGIETNVPTPVCVRFE